MSSEQGGDMDGADDDTQVSPRTWADAANEATQLSGRAHPARAAEDPDDDEDSTQLSSRAPADDATLLAAPRAAQPDATVRTGPRSAPTGETADDSTQVAASTRGRRARSRPNLPPGRIAGPLTETGAFGHAEAAYKPRGVPLSRANVTPTPASPASAVSPGQVLTPEQAARRREAARKRRLTAIIVIACVAAAALTATVLAAIAILGGAS